MPAGHFVYIPAILLFGLVAGWILGSRAAADAYAAELRRREDRTLRKKDPKKASPNFQREVPKRWQALRFSPS